MNDHRPPPQKTRITCAFFGEFAPPALACLRAWHRAGFDTRLLCDTRDGLRLARSAALDRRMAVPFPTEEEWTAWAGLLDVTGVTALSETRLRRLNAIVSGENARTGVWSPPSERLARLQQKDQQRRVAEESGFSTLPTQLLDADNENPPMPFPCVARPNEEGSRAGFKARHVPSEQALKSLAGKCATTLVLQPFRDWPSMVIHGARSVGGQILALHAWFVPDKHRGLALTLRPCALPEHLAEATRQFADRVGITGPFHIDLLWNPETSEHAFMEMNGRLGGTTPAVTACGYPEGAMVPCCYSDQFEVPEYTIHDRWVANRQALLRYAWDAIRGRLTPLDYPRRSRALALAFVAKAFMLTKDTVWDWRDVEGSVCLYLRNLLRQFAHGERTGA